MSIEIKQVHKLSQQLVMTPQLQQAIKLLQLSRMELVDLVHEEMMENPILEDGDGHRPGAGQGRPRRQDGGERLQGETELPVAEPIESRTPPHEVTGAESTAESQAVNEIDWENYLDNYSSAPPMPSFRRQRRAAVARGDAHQEDLARRPPGVAAQACRHCPPDEENVGMLIIGNLDADGYLKEPPLERHRRGRGRRRSSSPRRC